MQRWVFHAVRGGLPPSPGSLGTYTDLSRSAPALLRNWSSSTPQEDEEPPTRPEGRGQMIKPSLFGSPAAWSKAPGSAAADTRRPQPPPSRFLAAAVADDEDDNAPVRTPRFSQGSLWNNIAPPPRVPGAGTFGQQRRPSTATVTVAVTVTASPKPNNSNGGFQRNQGQPDRQGQWDQRGGGTERPSNNSNGGFQRNQGQPDRQGQWDQRGGGTDRNSGNQRRGSNHFGNEQQPRSGNHGGNERRSGAEGQQQRGTSGGRGGQWQDNRGGRGGGSRDDREVRVKETAEDLDPRFMDDDGSDSQQRTRSKHATGGKSKTTKYYAELAEQSEKTKLKEKWARKASAAPALDSALGKLMAAKASQAAASASAEQPPEPQLSKREMRRKAKEEAAAAEAAQGSRLREVLVSDPVTLVELSRALQQNLDDVQEALEDLGESVRSHDSPLSFDAAELTAGHFNVILKREAGASVGTLAPRPAVVAVMGHVDHGKTTLLDYLRKASVAAGEAGGITQHIGAFVVDLPEVGSSLTFLDTPGHAAFSEMRARGARVTDIVILVVAADDGVMEQTREALAHARGAGVPIVVAITKCDKPGVDIRRVKNQLLGVEMELEEFGGDVPVVEVSAKSGMGMDDLQHVLHLQAENLELQARVDCDAEGVVVEAHKDPGQGPLATLLVTRGMLRTGAAVVVGSQWGRIRAMKAMNSDSVSEATPAMPVAISGLKGVPNAGDTLTVVASDERARKLAEMRTLQSETVRLENQAVTKAQLELKKAAALKAQEELEANEEEEREEGYKSKNKDSDGPKELVLIVKADVDGTAEAVHASLAKLGSELVGVNVLASSVGAVTHSDIALAEAAGGVICAFNVGIPTTAEMEAKQKMVRTMSHNVIYHMLDEVGDLLKEIAPKRIEEEVVGRADILQVFDVKARKNNAIVAGCKVKDGRLLKAEYMRVLRGEDNEVVFDGRCASLRRHRQEVDVVGKNTECGVQLSGFTDFQPGDRVQCYEFVSKPARFEDVVGGGVRIIA